MKRKLLSLSIYTEPLFKILANSKKKHVCLLLILHIKLLLYRLSLFRMHNDKPQRGYRRQKTSVGVAAKTEDEPCTSSVVFMCNTFPSYF